MGSEQTPFKVEFLSETFAQSSFWPDLHVVEVKLRLTLGVPMLLAMPRFINKSPDYRLDVPYKSRSADEVGKPQEADPFERTYRGNFPAGQQIPMRWLAAGVLKHEPKGSGFPPLSYEFVVWGQEGTHESPTSQIPEVRLCMPRTVEHSREVRKEEYVVAVGGW